MADGQVVFEITGDNKPLKQSLNDTTSAIQRESRRWDSAADQSTKSISDSFGSMFKKISAAAAGAAIGKFLVNFGEAAIQVASDLQEVQNVVDVTFGSSANQIERWAKNAGTQFGLTELQAKRFTSTMGAMMKSAGLAGPEIVSMSTDLAGLAADMASFYNLDFETAFSKIRAGISGETEPLKQLGVNMSVANLEAYALSKGIKKAFNDMSQGEQVMLRYQYLMQATADAQGDFARTAGDSLANTRRQLETNLTEIQAKVGTLLIGPFKEATGILNDFLGMFTTTPKHTILDDFSNIDVERETKIADIKAIAAEAQGLVDILEKIGGDNSAGVAMASLAEGANKLNASSVTTWNGLLNALTKVDGLENIFSDTNAGKNVEELAQALSGNSPDTTKAQAWQTFLSALQTNPEALTALTKTSAEDTAAWLGKLANAANLLTPESADGWNTLLSNFVTGLPGLGDTPEGKTFLESMAQQYLSLGNQSDAAAAGLKALGFTEDQITAKQNAWIETCKRLVQIIPSLSDIIDTQTGEVKGGTQAIKDYVDAWSEENILKARIGALQEKKALLKQQMEIDYEIEKEFAKSKAIASLMSREGLTKEEATKYVDNYLSAEKISIFGKTPEETIQGMAQRSEMRGIAPNISSATAEALNGYFAAEIQLEDAQNTLPVAIKVIEEEEQQLRDELGATEDQLNGTADATEEAAKSMTKLEAAATGEEAAMKDVTAALENAQAAFKALADYQESVRNETERTVKSVVNGFGKIVTPVEKAESQMKDLEKSLVNAKTAEEIEKINQQMNELGGSKPTAQNMLEGLRSQLEYIAEYRKAMAAASAAGVSDELLAYLSDGSAESLDYLRALADGSANIEDLNEAYQQVQEESAAFTDELTQQKLAVDETYQALEDKAYEAVVQLNQYDGAKASVEATVQGIVDGLAGQKDNVQKQVDEILAQIARLEGQSGFGANFVIGNIFQPWKWFSHANGMDYVPYDGYFAMLHQGERIQTAAEADLYRRYGNQNPGTDIGGAIQSGLGNMQIIWRGRVVADVLSEQQGNSYRALERSGWKS
jgi:predicted  nucleic acid-binding Zn-ribbon protein